MNHYTLSCCLLLSIIQLIGKSNIQFAFVRVISNYCIWKINGRKFTIIQMPANIQGLIQRNSENNWNNFCPGIPATCSQWMNERLFVPKNPCVYQTTDTRVEPAVEPAVANLWRLWEIYHSNNNNNKDKSTDSVWKSSHVSDEIQEEQDSVGHDFRLNISRLTSLLPTIRIYALAVNVTLSRFQICLVLLWRKIKMNHPVFFGDIFCVCVCVWCRRRTRRWVPGKNPHPISNTLESSSGTGVKKEIKSCRENEERIPPK